MRRGVLAVALILGSALAGPPAGAIEPPPGTKNFTPPRSVPDYFSNEAAPFRGVRAAQPAADQFNPASVAAGNDGVAETPRHTRKASASAGRAKQRGKLVRGKTARSKAASSRQAARAGKARKGKTAIVRAAARSAVGKARSGKTAAGRAAAKSAGAKAGKARGRDTAGQTRHAASTSGRAGRNTR